MVNHSFRPPVPSNAMLNGVLSCAPVAAPPSPENDVESQRLQVFPRLPERLHDLPRNSLTRMRRRLTQRASSTLCEVARKQSARFILPHGATLHGVTSNRR